MVNPMLKPATLWAMDPTANFPWTMSMGFPFGGPGGPGGPPTANLSAALENGKAANNIDAPNRKAGGPNGPGGFGGGFRGPPGGGGPGGDGPDLCATFLKHTSLNSVSAWRHPRANLQTQS